MARLPGITLTNIQKSLALEDFDGRKAQMAMSPAGRERMKPQAGSNPRQAAVLVLIYPDADSGLNLILTKRTDSLRGHSGQVSFPGGSVDDDDASYEAAALRETCEELGICDTSTIQILGRLSTLWIPPSNFEVVPIVAYIDHLPKIIPSPFEVAKVLHMSLSALIDDATKCTTPMTFRGQTWDVPYYDVDDHVVWGATCAMLSEFEQRLKTILNNKITKNTE